MAIATTDVQGVGAGVVVGFLAAPGLLPLVSWTVTIVILLTWVWWMSWPQDSEGTKRLAEQENSTMSMDVWLLAAALASLAVVAVSETEPTTTVMRRVVLGHALLSYMFGPGVLTVVMSLGQRHGWPLRVSDPAVKGE